MLGAFAGKIMKEGKANRKKVVQTLSVIGVLLVGLAMLWSLQMPIIKRLWTGSMTLLSGGYCFLLMALFYYWIDYKGHSRGLNWLKVYGMNSITAYLLGEVVNFRCIADRAKRTLASSANGISCMGRIRQRNLGNRLSRRTETNVVQSAEK